MKFTSIQNETDLADSCKVEFNFRFASLYDYCDFIWEPKWPNVETKLNGI